MRATKLIAAGSFALALTLGAVAAHAQDTAVAPASAPAAAAVTGKGVLVIDDVLLNQVLKQHPTSMTGALLTATWPVGQQLRDQGIADLKATFTDGVDTATTAQAGAYNIVLRLDNFSYKYAQTAMGFSVTPKVSLTITADITAPDGTTTTHKSYVRKDFSAGAYVASLNPPKKVIAAANAAVDDIYAEMDKDIIALVPASTTVTPPVDTNTVEPAPSVPSDAAASSASSSSDSSSSETPAPAQ